MNGLQTVAGAAMVLLVQSTILLMAVFLISQRLRSKGPAASALACKAGLIGLVVLCAVPFIRLPEGRAVVLVPAPPSVAMFGSTQHALSPVVPVLRKPNAAIVPTAVRPLEEPVNSPLDLSQTKPAPEARKTLSLSMVLLVTWATGTCLLLTWVAWAQLSLSILRRRSKTLTDGLAYERLSALSASRGLPIPELRVDPSVDGPFAIGTLRPAILMNPSAAEEMDSATLDLIFEHELAHIRGKDCAWRVVERMLCALLWPQPLLWRLCARLDQSSEEVCDQIVIANSPSRRQYADCLLSLANSSWYSPAEKTLGVGVVPFRSGIGRRIAKIMDSSQQISTHVSRRNRFGIAAVTVALAAGIATMVSGSAPVLRHSHGPLGDGQNQSDQQSDPEAEALWTKVQDAYRGLSTFAATVKQSGNGNPVVFKILYKQPGHAALHVMAERLMVVNKVVYIDPSGVTTTWPKNPKIYQADRPEDMKFIGKDGVEQTIPKLKPWSSAFLNGAIRRSMVGPTPAYFLLSGIPDIGAIASFTTGRGGELKLGPDEVLNGETVRTIVASQSGTGANSGLHTTETYYIGKTDYLLRKVEKTNSNPRNNQTWGATDVYENIRINLPIEDREVVFHAPAGATELKPFGGSPKPPANIQALLDKAKDAYKNLNSLSFVAKTIGGTKGTFSAALKKPNLTSLSLTYDNYPTQNLYSVSDGTSVYTWQGVHAEKYLQDRATQSSVDRFGGMGIPVNSFYTLIDTVRWALFGLRPNLIQGEMKMGQPGFVMGVPVDNVIASTPLYDSAGMPSNESYVRTTYSFGQKDHLLYQVLTHDHSDNDGKIWDRQIGETLVKLSVDQPLADDTFAFHPGSMTRATTLRQASPQVLAQPGIEIGDRFPAFTAVDKDGKPFSLDQYKGKVLLIHAWSFGVTNYKADVPVVNALYKKYKKLGFEAVELACDGQSERPQIEKYLAANGIQTRQIIKEMDAYHEFVKKMNTHEFPFTYLISRDGKVFAVNPWIPKLEPALRAVLAEGE